MKYLLMITALLLSAMANAGLVPVNTSQYVRGSGGPTTDTTTITLETAGEIRISNISLEDDAIEVVASTVVELNGAPVLSPFTVPHGGFAVFPLDAGAYNLSVTVAGKPTGGITVTFYEDQPDAPVQGKGWELLSDGTVLHRKTNYIWHRKVGSPGIPRPTTNNTDYQDIYPDNSPIIPAGYLSISQYIANLNAGVYGTSAEDGNAGYTDWRAPTIEELISAMTFDATGLPITDKDGNTTIYPEPRVGWQGGMQPGDPLYACAENWYGLTCPDLISWQVHDLITNDRVPIEAYKDSYRLGIRLEFAEMIYPFKQYGSVWPIRGDQ